MNGFVSKSKKVSIETNVLSVNTLLSRAVAAIFLYGSSSIFG